MQIEGKTLSERSGLTRFVRDIQHNRHRTRQLVGISFIILLTIVGMPTNAELYFAGVAVATLGIAVRLWASGHVNKDKVLATTGPYAYVRHPLYVGNHLIAFGFCLASGLWWSFLAWIAIGFFYYPQTIAHEDQQLARLFPGDWGTWSKETRALIPRFTPYRSGQVAQWSLRQSLRQNGEGIIAALLFLFLFILYGPLS
ncbi:MAG: methyltransferase family protein [Burkholderiales bacterium]